MRLCRAVGRGYPRSHWGRSRIPPSSIPTGRLGNSTLLLLPGERRLSRGDNCGRRRKRPPGGVPGARGPPRPAAPEEGPPGPPQLPGRAAPAPPRLLTSSAWPSSKSEVTTHTHSNQAEKRAQGAAGARAWEDGALRWSRALLDSGRDSASMAARSGRQRVARGTAPRRCRGNSREAVASAHVGPRCGAVERPAWTRAALLRSRPPLAAGGAPYRPERRARAS